MSSSPGTPPPGRLMRRGIVVLGIVVLALLAFGSTTQTWLAVRLPQESVQTPDLLIAGSDASTPVTAFALVALAAALAVSIAGRVARWIIAVILVLSGIGIALSSAGVALDPGAAAEPAIGTAIGISGSADAETTATLAPWLAVLAGILLVLAAVWVVVAGRAWGINRRYDTAVARVPSARAVDTATGDTAAKDAEDTAASPTGDGRPTGQRSAHSDEIDSWDQLSRGNDPTG